MMSPMLVAAEGFEDRLSLIITALIVIGYPVVIFGLYKIFDLRFYGTNPNSWLIGFSIVIVLIYFAYGLPGMLLNLKKGIPNSGYFKTETEVYRNGKIIKEADPTTFDVIDDSNYSKDNNSVFYYSEKVIGADAGSFGPVVKHVEDTLGARTAIYWKDKNNVFFEGKRIEKSDAKSFEHISGLYAKDDNYIYYENKVLTNNDPAKVRFLDGGIVSDGSALYIYSKKSKTPIDYKTVEVINNDGGIYVRDSTSIYLLFYGSVEPLVKVEGADPATFELLERYYAKDKDHVYYYGSDRTAQEVVKLKGADPRKFSLGYDEATDTEARDGKNHYMYGKRVKVD